MDMPETADYQKLLFLLLGTELDHTFLLSLGVAMWHSSVHWNEAYLMACPSITWVSSFLAYVCFFATHCLTTKPIPYILSQN